MYLRVKKINPLAVIPTYAHPDDSGMDLYAVEELVILPQCRVLVNTGIAICLPPFTEAQIRPRSGLALKSGITVLNTPGTIDESYCGEGDEIKVILINLGSEPFFIQVHDRIAQMVITPVLRPEIIGVKMLNVSQDRGGFGSTGIGNYDRQIVD